MAWRTACRPPRRSCSATGICSGRSAASMALRCTVEVGAAGRSPRPVRVSPSPGLRPPGRRGPFPLRGRSPRSRRGVASPSPLARRRLSGPSESPSPRRRGRDPGARITDTSGARFGVPRTSIRPSVFSGDCAGLAGRATGSQFPRARPRRRHATRHPRLRHWGRVMRPPSPWADARQPARQVHDPSPDWLVNSMSIRRDMRRTRYRAPRVREDWDIPGSRNMARGRQSETGAEAGGGLIDPGMVLHQGSHPVRRNPHERGHRALRARARDRSSTALGVASVAHRGCRP